MPTLKREQEKWTSLKSFLSNIHQLVKSFTLIQTNSLTESYIVYLVMFFYLAYSCSVIFSIFQYWCIWSFFYASVFFAMYIEISLNEFSSTNTCSVIFPEFPRAKKIEEKKCENKVWVFEACVLKNGPKGARI